MTLLSLPGRDDLGWTAVPGSEPGGPLLVVLGGMPLPGQVPAFEGRGLCRRLGVRGLLLRDHAESWYLGGVQGMADGLPGLAEAVRAHAAGDRVVLVGNSAGGYAALVLGALLQADEVVAVVPRSGLSEAANPGDLRLLPQRLRTLAEHAGSPYLDLPPVLTAAFDERVRREGARPAYRTRYRVLHAVDNAFDAAHAARLTGLPETTVTCYPRGDHQLAGVLRTAGELDPLVAAALAGPARLQVSVPA